ncbi:Siderophore iron transporter [Wickerhamomyces ciferrii]|uniref:Siderophore iron transporter n=1 Tax=Wickerhamomyces ciferrii (strain ATCC 14091 / BCRC 22168 / CBS 111 / JCM 3599 / NBRC 0793 / NRRL Y-1031 F-60-10) TaxID=1206466 RepID=K0KNP1_WICCF|nr:Siderophore iron transporter [Wickerhamomyces ciferrii]CCH46885.1 Siderophore iron transporter [Wickerhamomyces ciferrii]
MSSGTEKVGRQGSTTDNVYELNDANANRLSDEENQSSGLKGNDSLDGVDSKAIDDYALTKSIALKKTEILAQQYNTIWYRILLLFSAFLIGYGYGLDSQIRSVYTGYATSSYGEHSMIATIGVINAVIGAASQIAYARLSDIFGRLELLIVAIFFYVIGTIIQSQAFNIQNYCAGAVFYNLGYVGVLIVVLFILSDFSSLRWRLFYSFVPALPFIINTWISGNVTSAVGPIKHWSWGIGMWAFIFPLSALPFVGCIVHMRWKAGKTAEWKAIKQQKTFYQSHGLVSFLRELYWRVDIMGVLIFTISIGCLLVPLTLAGGIQSKWKTGKIIGPLVLGFVLFPIFILYESFVAKYPMVPFKLLKDRGVWAAIAISFMFDFVFYMYNDYLYTILIVGMNQSVTSATRIASVSTFTSTVWSLPFAYIVKMVRRLKAFIILGCSLYLLGLGLLYHYRGYEYAKNGVIGALVVIGLGNTMYSYPNTVSVQAVTSHDNMATVTAILYTTYRVGSAVGNAVSGAVWQNTLPGKLARRLSPYNNQTLVTYAYAKPYEFIVDYPYGTPIRTAVIEAYKEVQRMETIIALVFCATLIGFAFFLRDPELTDEQAHNNLDEGELVYTKGGDPIVGFVKRFRSKKN